MSVLLHSCLVCFVLPRPLKATANAVGSHELESNIWCDLVTSESKHLEDDLTDEPGSVAGAEARAAPWEKCYEKLWVEVEKRQVKSNYKNVACELKEKFGELLRPGAPAEEDEERDEPEEDSSDEEEGEVIMRPTARARSTVLLTIPEQRESGLEDSESIDRSAWEDRKVQVKEQQSSNYPGPDLSTNHQQSTRTSIVSSSLQSASHNKFLQHETETTVLQPRIPCQSNTASPHLAEKKLKNPEDPAYLVESTKSQPLSKTSHAAPVQNASLKGLEEEGVEKKEEEVEQKKRFKLDVATPKFVLQDLKRKNYGLQREVEEAVALAHLI